MTVSGTIRFTSEDEPESSRLFIWPELHEPSEGDLYLWIESPISGVVSQQAVAAAAVEPLVADKIDHPGDSPSTLVCDNGVIRIGRWQLGQHLEAGGGPPY